MKKFKTIAACALTVALALSSAACGGKSGNGGSESEVKTDYSLSYIYDGRGAYTVSGYTAGYVADAIEKGKNISSLEIPSSYLGKPVTAIADGAFRNSDFLYEVKIPDSITYIGSNAFDGCSELRRLDLGNGVSHIAESAFNECDSLGVVLYWGSVADWCGITFVDPAANPVTWSADFYIDGARANVVRVPSSVTYIKPYAFYGCTAIKSVGFSDELKNIGDGAFAGCTALGEVSLGGTKTIGDGAFMYTAIKSITLPETLEQIGDNAFRECRFLYEVYDNAGLGVTVGDDTFGGVGEYAMDIRGADEPSGIKRSGEYVFYKSAAKDETYLVGAPAADQKPVLPTTETPYTVAPGLFAGTPIVSVTLSPSVTKVGGYAFAYCTRLAEITVCKELTSFGEGAFNGDDALKTVNYNGTAAEFDAIMFVAEAGEPSSNPLFNGAKLVCKE